MKSLSSLFQKGNSFPFLMLLSFMFSSFLVSGQTAPTVFARVVYQKVEPGKEQEFEKMLKESWKAAHQVRKQNGKITNWALYRVQNTGTLDPYNYATVSYYDSWAKTEPNDNWTDLIKAGNPKSDPAAILAKTLTLRTIVRQALYNRVDGVTPKNPVVLKYVQLGFMKVRDGMNDEYVNVERDVWKPVHQILTDDGKRAGWTLWAMALPGGTGSWHDFVTSNLFISYAQMTEGSYPDAFKKAHPEKDMQALFDRTERSRNLVRNEVWELVDSLN